MNERVRAEEVRVGDYVTGLGKVARYGEHGQGGARKAVIEGLEGWILQVPIGRSTKFLQIRERVPASRS